MTDNNVGGLVYITIDGATYSPSAEVEVEESGIEVEGVVNYDGSGGRQVKPKLIKVKLSIRDRRDLDMDALLRAESFDLTQREPEMGRTLILTGAWATGTPSRNTSTGEISGVDIEVPADRFQRLTA